MLRALPVTGEDRISACHREVGGWVESCSKVADHGARIRRTLPPPPNPELDALCSYLGQPRGRLLEGAQRLVDHNNELRVSRDAWAREAQDTANTLAAVALLNTHLKTARQGWADESAAACRARVERDKSRAEVATLTEQVASLRAAKDEVVSWETAAKMLLSPLSQDWSGNRLRERTFEYAMGGWQRAETLSRECVSLRKTGADIYAELTTLRDAARTLLPADSTPNPATGWLADVIRSTGSTIADLRAALNKTEAQAQRDRIAARNGRIGTLEAEVESLTAALRSLREQRDGLRASLVQAQDTAAGWMAEHDKVAAEAADLWDRLAAARQKRPQVVVNIGAGRTVTAPEPLKTSGLLTYSAEGNGPPAPAANLEPLRRAACALIDAAAALAHPKAA